MNSTATTTPIHILNNQNHICSTVLTTLWKSRKALCTLCSKISILMNRQFKGVRLAKMTSVRFWKKTAVFGSVSLKLTALLVFGSVFLYCVLFNVCDARNDVLSWWIGPTNCQPKWLRTRSAEIWHEEKYFFDPMMLEDELWMRQCENCLQTAEVGFLKTEPWKLSFRFLNFKVGSVFRNPISDIFIGFRTPLVITAQRSKWHISLAVNKKSFGTKCR